MKLLSKICNLCVLLFKNMYVLYGYKMLKKLCPNFEQSFSASKYFSPFIAVKFKSVVIVKINIYKFRFEICV